MCYQSTTHIDRPRIKTAAEVRAKVLANAISKRYVAQAAQAGFIAWGVYDQRERRFIPDDELPNIDPEARMTLK